MSDRLNEIWQQFSLSSEEELVEIEEPIVEDTVKKGRFSLLVKLLTPKPYNREAFKQAMLTRWRPAHGACMKDMGDNLFIAIFKDQMDRDIVLMNNP